MDPKQAAQQFLEAHAKAHAISRDVALVESIYLGPEGLGSAGMETAGVYDDYTHRSKEREELVAEMKRLRAEAGDEAILAELSHIQGGERAAEYIRTVPLHEDREKNELKKEVRKGWFERLR